MKKQRGWLGKRKENKVSAMGELDEGRPNDLGSPRQEVPV